MIKSFEGGRGVAALIVALYHLKIGADHFTLIRNGYLFVDLFFVLSGFVMCASYARKINSYSDFQSFFIRRVGRLLPLLIFSTVVFILASDLIVFAKRIAFDHGYAGMLHHPGALSYLIPSSFEILATLTLAHSMGLFDHLILNTPSWSISVEFYTYLVFAAICYKARNKSHPSIFFSFSVIGLIISVLASATIHGCLVKKGCLSLTYDFGFTRSLFSFFLGALAFRAGALTILQQKIGQIAGLLLLAFIFDFVDVLPALAFMSPLVFALILVTIRNDIGIFSELMKLRVFQMLGQRSYSIYLMHMSILLVFENFAKRVHGAMPSVLILVGYVAVLIWVSGWTYRFIENPMRIRFNRIGNQKNVLPGGATILHPKP